MGSTHLDSIFSESQCRFRSGRGTTDMLYAARHVQEKCREQNLDPSWCSSIPPKLLTLYNRKGLWKLLLKAGCPLRVVKIIGSFHDGIMARVSHLGTTSEDFPVTNGTKQGCLMAPLLFCIVFSAMLQDAFRNCSSGVLISRPKGNRRDLRKLRLCGKVRFRDHVSRH